MKNMVSPDELINVTVINLHRNTISRPSLKEDFLPTSTLLTSQPCSTPSLPRQPLWKDSLKPLQRMRHATCVVKTKHLPASEARLINDGGGGGSRRRNSCSSRSSTGSQD